MIYTSYFAKLNKFPDHFIPISICGKAPDWYTGLQYKKLAPKYDFFMKWKENHDNEYYVDCFNKQVLQPLEAYEVYDDLHKLAKSSLCNDCNYNICLICYEKPQDFCHRHLVADWFRKNNIICEEYEF